MSSTESNTEVKHNNGLKTKNNSSTVLETYTQVSPTGGPPYFESTHTSVNQIKLPNQNGNIGNGATHNGSLKTKKSNAVLQTYTQVSPRGGPPFFENTTTVESHRDLENYTPDSTHLNGKVNNGTPHNGNSKTKKPSAVLETYTQVSPRGGPPYFESTKTVESHKDLKNFTPDTTHLNVKTHNGTPHISNSKTKKPTAVLETYTQVSPRGGPPFFESTKIVESHKELKKYTTDSTHLYGKAQQQDSQGFGNTKQDLETVEPITGQSAVLY